MTKQGVLIEEDASEHAIRRVRRPQRPEPPPPSMKAQAWLALERRRRDLEAQLKTVTAEQEKVRVALLEEWSMTGTSREVVAGLTIHLQRKLYPKVADKGRLTAALLERGFTDLVTVDEKAFAIYVTTSDEEGRPLPPEIAEHLGESFERFSIAVRLK